MTKNEIYSKIFEKIENFIFDFFTTKEVNEIINTKDEAIAIEKRLRDLLSHYLFK